MQNNLLTYTLVGFIRRAKTLRERLLFMVALSSLAPLAVSAEGLPAPVVAASFAHAAFSALWERTDAAVASGAVRRTWLWGPQPNSVGLQEDYKEGAGGKRLVQYFDKSRMELNDPSGDPNSPFYVTNGLLTVELISGRMQVGQNSFVTLEPSHTNVTGDYGDPLAPSYASLAGISSVGRDRRDSDRSGQPATATLSKEGKMGSDTSKAGVVGVLIAYYERTTGHNVPQAFWNYLNSTGTVREKGVVGEKRLMDPWFYASGLPISDAYWVRATISGKPTDVLVQAYERRVLTYVPTNPEGFKVEMGNIGQHYYNWRYRGQFVPTPAPTPTPVPGVALQLPRFSVDVIEDTSAATLDAMKSAGARGVRMYLSWKVLEPLNVLPDKYNWSKYDTVFKAVSDRTLQPITIISDCPAWACPAADGPLYPERVADFVQFTSALSARYGKPPYNAHNWELWNEPDSSSEGARPNNWGRYGARYAAMLGAVRPGIKASDPKANVIMGGVAYDFFLEDGGLFVRRFVDDVLNAGGGQYLDAFNFHYYADNIHWCSPTEKLNELRGKLKAHGLDRLPIISTETGHTSDPKFGSSEEMQSIYVAQVYAQNLGEGMASTTWFLSRDFTAEAEDPGSDFFSKMGLLNLEGAPKLAQRAYRTAVEQIGQRPAQRSLGVNDGISGKMRGYEFARDAVRSGPLWALWASDLSRTFSCGAAPPARDWTIPGNRAGDVRRVVDIYGQTVQTRAGTGGSLIFSLDARPVYIEWSR